MKRLLLFFAFTAIISLLYAQDEVACVPDTSQISGNNLVFPLPLNEEGEGGLAAFPACINEDFELVFTLIVPDSLNANGNLIDITYAEIETTGAITGLPEGVDYFCNPPNCIFPDTLAGCIVLRGIPTSNNAAGAYELVIVANAQLGPLPFPVTFPGPLVPGSYSLTLNEEGNCIDSTTSVNYLAEQISLGNTPNPVQFQTKIEMTSLVAGDFQFSVMDMAGRVVQQQPISLQAGYNTFQLDASDLENGMYLYTLSDGKAVIYEKMIVER